MLDPRKNIILTGRFDKPQARQLGRELLDWLSQHARVVADNLDGRLDLNELPPADFLLVLGGDGTILATARALKGREIPIIGVNVGKLGFLAEFSITQLKQHFDRIVSDPELITKRMMLSCRIKGPQRPDEYVTTAVNELAVIAGPPFRMIEVSVSIADEHLALCAGDGLIVATPTGSTAYNLSAGGPILMSTLDAVVITPLAAHSLSFRPVVVNLDKLIIIRCRDNRPAAADKNEPTSLNCGVAAIDGQTTIPLKSKDEIIITQAQPRFLLVRNPQQGQWRLLNTKLHWGASPHYNRRLEQ